MKLNFTLKVKPFPQKKSTNFVNKIPPKNALKPKLTVELHSQSAIIRKIM